MSWQVFIGFSILLSSLSTILQKLLLRDDKTDPMAFSIFFQLITGLIIGGVGFFFGQMDFSHLEEVSFNLLLMTILYLAGNIFLFKSLQKIDASELAVIFSSRTLFTILASTILIKEGLTLVQWLGTLFIFISIVLVSIKSKKLTLGKFEVLALAGAVCFGLAVTNDRIVLTQIKLYPYVTMAFLLPAITTMFLFPKSTRALPVFLKPNFIFRTLLICIIYAAGSVLFFTALQINSNSSQVVSLNLTTVILTVILSFFFLGERSAMIRKVLGATLNIVGILLLGK